MLEEKERELREAQHLAKLATWQWNPKTDQVVWSDALYRATGHDPKLPVPLFKEHHKFFTADSWRKLTHAVESTLRTGAPYELELEIVRPDGTRCWITARGEAVRDTRGNIFQLRGTIQDITTETLAIQALRRSEEKFTKAFRSIPVAVLVVTLAEGRQIEVNDALLEMTGYAREEVIGHTFRELGYWVDSDDREQLVRRLLAGETIRNVECRFCRKDGNPFIGLISSELVELNGEQCIVSAVMDIDDLRRAEQAIRTLESKLALHFEQTLFGVVEWDRSLHVREWNPAAEQIFGYPREEALGRDARDLIVPADLLPQVTAAFAGLLRQTSGNFATNDNITSDGRRIICEWFNTPLIGDDGNVIGVMSLVRDVTVREKAKSELAASQAILSSLFESTEDMIWIVEPENFGLTMFNTGILRYFAHARGIQLRVGMSPDELLPTPALAELWRSYYTRALKEGSFKTEYETVGHDILELSLYPLISSQKVFGVSVFGRNVTAVRRVERALKDSEERYRKLIESSHDWVWEVDAQGRYKYVGPQCRDILGYEPEEILGRTPFDFMPEAEARRVSERYREIVAARKPFHLLENINVHKTGRQVVLETNGTPVLDESGNPTGFLGMDRDITERKRSEIALQESEQRYRTLADHLPAVSFQFYARDNGERGFYFVHENSRDFLGLEVEPLETWGKRFASCVDADDLRMGTASIRNAIASAGIWDFETKFRKPTGEEIYVRGLSRPERHDNELVFHGIVLDITPRKLAEKALRESEERLRLAAEAGRMYAFEWNPDTDAVQRSAECAEILGLTPSEMNIGGQEFLARVNADDAQCYIRSIARLSPDAPSFKATYRYARPDGSTIWLEEFVRGYFDDNGRLLRTIGMTSDVTARKQAEQTLNDLSGRLINAQEEERKRVARELHDGVSQALALISIGVAQASKMSPDPALTSRLDQLYEKVQTVISDIGQLSHELHPSTLKHLGLTSAIRFLCRETCETHGIDAEFIDGDAPQPSKEVSLCLFRIAQEALQNIVKHSGSRRAWLELRGNANEISLRVWDEGKGFDVLSHKAGLGLVSMRERLRLVRGKIDITSHSNYGTRIEVRVPLAIAFDAAA